MENQPSISGKTRMICLFGNPTGHSLSPAMHNLSFRLLGVDAIYVCFDVGNESLPGIVDAFKGMAGFDGFNLTMPCKQAIIPLLDGLDDAAELIGAVNVVKKDGNRAIGFNTDGKGFMANLEKHGVQVPGARMVLLGPGGAGSAILAQAALDGISSIDVFARAGGASYRAGLDLAARVAGKTGCSISLHEMPQALGSEAADTLASGRADESADASEEARRADLAACIREADILVNATSVGMGEGCEETLVAPELLRPDLAVADVIYHPRETRLIRDARAHGCVAIPGLGMLIEQAAVGEAIWYGVDMPIDEIERQLF